MLSSFNLLESSIMEALKETIVSQLSNTYVLVGAVLIGLAIAAFVYFKVFPKTTTTSAEEFVASPPADQAEQVQEQEQMEQTHTDGEQSYDQ